MRLLILSVFFAALASCTAVKPCSATCGGCCDEKDQCQTGTSTATCGVVGARCIACALGQSCQAGFCTSNSTGGGSGGGTSGTGGGTGGGQSGTGGGASGTGGGSGGGTADGGSSANKPNVLLVVDTSGSMETPISTTAPGCTATCGAGNPCSAGCPTRWSILTDGVSNVLAPRAASARFGLTTFPTANTNQCAAPTISDITTSGVDLPTGADDPTLLENQTRSVHTKLITKTRGGGTPTSGTLSGLVGYAPFHDASRRQYVVLLTDGLPNCNPSNPNTCNTPTACQCTNASCAGSLCAIGCLDSDATTSAAAALKSEGVTTIVIGIGPELVAAGTVMSQVSQAGGFTRHCPNGTNAECSPGTCNPSTHTCSSSYFLAASQVEIETALSSILDSL